MMHGGWVSVGREGGRDGGKELEGEEGRRESAMSRITLEYRCMHGF